MSTPRPLRSDCLAGSSTPAFAVPFASVVLILLVLAGGIASKPARSPVTVIAARTPRAPMPPTASPESAGSPPVRVILLPAAPATWRSEPARNFPASSPAPLRSARP